MDRWMDGCEGWNGEKVGWIKGYGFDEYLDVTQTVNDALKGIEQNTFGGNLDGFRFGGTNIIMEPARIVLLDQFR